MAVKSNITTHTITTIFLTFFAVIQVILNARFLGPEKLAIIAVFYMLMSIIEHFFEFGFNKALIQKQKLDNAHVNVVFYITVLKGVLISLIIFLFSSNFENFFGVEGLSEVLVILSLVPFIKSMRNTYAVILHRSLNFKLYGKWMISSSFFKLICIIIGLSFYPEAISIAFAIVIAELFSTSLSYILVSNRPSIKFSYYHLVSLWNYGKWVFLAAIVAIAERQGAQFLTVKLLSAIELSMLYIALQFLKIPTFFSNTVKGFLFPNFSRLLSNTQKLKIYYKYGNTFLLLSFGYFLLISISLGEQLIVQLLGNEWMGIGTLFALLVFSKIFDSFTGLDISLMNGLGYPKYAFINHSVKATLLVVFCIAFIKSYGLIGVGLSFILSSTISWITLRYLTLNRAAHINAIKKLYLTIVIFVFIVSLIVFEIWNFEMVFTHDFLILFFNIIYVSSVYFLLLYLVSCVIKKTIISYEDISIKLKEIMEL
tara:strand:- start:28177 stop:29625 length:1449 start_codon:yes stop_codon:yes gene_type:complete